MEAGVHVHLVLVLVVNVNTVRKTMAVTMRRNYQMAKVEETYTAATARLLRPKGIVDFVETSELFPRCLLDVCKLVDVRCLRWPGSPTRVAEIFYASQTRNAPSIWIVLRFSVPGTACDQISRVCSVECASW